LALVIEDVALGWNPEGLPHFLPQRHRKRQAFFVQNLIQTGNLLDQLITATAEAAEPGIDTTTGWFRAEAS